MSLIVRPVLEQDKAHWRRLWTGYLTFYNSSVPDAVYETTFARLLSDDRRAPRGLVAELDGTLVGLTHYFFHPHAWRVEEVCYLQDLFADQSVRGHGIGRALIEAVYKAADEAGAPSVYWMTEHHNHEARRLYDRIGTLTNFIKYQRPL
ncbi:MAG: GNAT family N-acetyltransferase [Pseudomonadota bacterium]